MFNTRVYLCLYRGDVKNISAPQFFKTDYRINHNPRKDWQKQNLNIGLLREGAWLTYVPDNGLKVDTLARALVVQLGKP